MSKHELLAAHLRSLEDYRCNLAADALEAQAREIADMQQQESELCTLHAMAEAECKRLRTEIEALRKDAERAELMLQVSCNHGALEIMRKKAERYDYLTLQHGEYCVADASTAGAIFKGSAADQLIDTAKGAPHG